MKFLVRAGILSMLLCVATCISSAQAPACVYPTVVNCRNCPVNATPPPEVTKSVIWPTAITVFFNLGNVPPAAANAALNNWNAELTSGNPQRVCFAPIFTSVNTGGSYSSTLSYGPIPPPANCSS